MENIKPISTKKIGFIVLITLVSAVVFLLYPRQTKISINETGGGLTGKAPVYSVTIFDTGKVEYFGQDYVKVLGKVSLRLSKEKVDRLFREIKKNNIEQLKEEYKILPDSTVTILSIYINGNKKVIAHDTQSGPKELIALENEIRKTVKNLVK